LQVASDFVRWTRFFWGVCAAVSLMGMCRPLGWRVRREAGL